MKTKANVIPFPPGSTTANGVLHLPLDDSKSELMTPLGYLALSLTEAFRSMLVSNISNSHYHKTSSNYSYCTCLLGLVETFIANCLPFLGLLQAWKPWLSNTSITSMDRPHLITGQLVSSPLEALRLESGVQNY